MTARPGPHAARAAASLPPAVPDVVACDRCLRRADLIAAIAGWIDVEWRRRGAPPRVLALGDKQLVALDSTGAAGARYERFDPRAARARCAAVGLAAVCRCAPAYPDRLRALDDPPAVLHIAGDPAALTASPAVAVVGARRASSYGLELSRSIARGLSAAGVVVVSGMALGVDSAAHDGALAGRAPTVAVLAGSADVPYPARAQRLYAGIVRAGAVVSELPPGARAYRWTFVARNRIIAALSAATIVIEAATRSGSLTTADFTLGLGRPLGAAPGPVTSSRSAGTNALLKAGAELIRDAADVLDLLAFEGHDVQRSPHGAAADEEQLSGPLQTVLAAVEEGRGTVAALARNPAEARAALMALTELELRGLIRREFGGRYMRSA